MILADTDVGSSITAAKYEAELGYQLLLLQFVLVQILYIVLELTANSDTPVATPTQG